MMLLPAAVFVLFGATGDLARRKIIPALFHLFLAGETPQRFAVICMGRRELLMNDLLQNYRSAVALHSRHGTPDEQHWQAFAGNFHYLQGELQADGTYLQLRDMLADITREWGVSPEVIHYLAIPPDLFSAVTDGLGRAGFAEDRARARIVVEKPLGRDLSSFFQVNTELRRFFDENQIYRIDHYLGKETVQNILALRFGNPIFEPIWNRHFVDHVTITVAEKAGIGRRGHYYEEAGALRDMVQNHLLQLLCLIAMEPPSAYTAENLRNHKMDVLHALAPISPEDVERVAVRGQYGSATVAGQHVNGYREETGVVPDSGVETFAAIKLNIENWRWKGVPFYLRSGKRMAEDISEIAIRFQRVPHCFFPQCEGLNQQPAELAIKIQPDPAVLLTFVAKEPGYQLQLLPVTLRFGYRETFGGDVPEAYETLLRDVMLGDATLFMRADQVEAAWQWVGPVLKAWESKPVDFPDYAAGSWGPAAADALVHRDGRRWTYQTAQ